MGEIIDNEEHENTDVVRVGDDDATIPLKLYQAVYHQITGRSEKIRKRYSDNLRIDFNELNNLHQKMMQLCDVHSIVASNLSIAVFHAQERKEQFTSFERFRAYNTGTSSPTVSLLMKYNFSLTPAGVSQPQEYEVAILLSSRIAQQKELEDDAPPFLKGDLSDSRPAPQLR